MRAPREDGEGAGAPGGRKVPLGAAGTLETAVGTVAVVSAAQGRAGPPPEAALWLV